MKVRAAFFFLVYVVAANVPYWIATRSIGFLLTGVFNFELLVVGALSLFVRRWVAVVLLVVGMLMDIVRGIGLTYLLSPSEMMGSARFLPEAVPAHAWGAVAVAMAIGVVCFLVVLMPAAEMDGREQVCVLAGLVMFAAVCGAVDLQQGHTSLFHRDTLQSGLRFTRLPVHSLIMSQVQYEQSRSMRVAGADVPVVAASKVMARFDGGSVAPQMSAMEPNVVLVLVESWGEAVSAGLEASLVRPYGDARLTARYTVTRGTVPFHGPTVAGEARELCGSAMGFGLLKATRSQFSRCLPAEMKLRGYHSVAVHGYSAQMFDRGEWYGRMGFDETWFRDRLKGQGLPICPGPFPGICDAAAAAWLGERLQREGDAPQFIYWVTLNSHLPVPVPNLVANPPSCGSDAATAESAAVCSWYQLVFNVHRSVAEMVMRDTARPTVFLVVGDHAPPFASVRLRGEFSDRVVPYVLLVPKVVGGSGGGDAMAGRAVAGMSRAAGARRLHSKRGRVWTSPAEG